MKNKFYYKNIFMYGSLQSVGHTEEYFVRHTEKLVVYIIMPRVQGRSNILRIYKSGRLAREFSVWSSGNFFLYYTSWFFHYWIFILTFFDKSEPLLVLSGHPISFFGMTIQKLLLPRISYAYWIGDYFPPVHWSLILFEKLKKFYHDRVAYTYYLSDRINELFNGQIMQLPAKRTVMWGVAPYKGAQKVFSRPFCLLFVGVIRPSQGIEDLLMFLKNTPHVHLSIIGVCETTLYTKYMNIIGEFKLTERVWFPNTFVDDTELKKLASRHHVGIALYEKGEHTATHYTDPGKVKTYIEMGLPVVMTNTSAVAPFVKQFRAGEVIQEASQLQDMLETIKRRYQIYQGGLHAFATYFEYEKYYRKAFRALEK